MGSLYPFANQDRGEEGGIGGGQDNPDPWLAWVALGGDSCQVQSDRQTLEEQPSLPVSVHTRSQAGGDGQRAHPPPQLVQIGLGSEVPCKKHLGAKAQIKGRWPSSKTGTGIPAESSQRVRAGPSLQLCTDHPSPCWGCSLAQWLWGFTGTQGHSPRQFGP